MQAYSNNTCNYPAYAVGTRVKGVNGASYRIKGTVMVKDSMTRSSNFIRWDNDESSWEAFDSLLDVPEQAEIGKLLITLNGEINKATAEAAQAALTLRLAETKGNAAKEARDALVNFASQ